ncbi:hypothetical protein [Neobacillus jeddahensis]|uniref:hypothetical protein n=1 Tax=Neobacillus jeddahensis TaxID=1461580 RepID=UPI00058E2D38|nr:hypothetical protein [Neobacillus jeddahensis]
MGKILILIGGLFLPMFLYLLDVQGEELPRLSADCLKNMRNRDEQYNKTIMNDIITSLELDINEQSYIEVTDRGLDAANLIYGGKEIDEYYQSLHDQFIVASRGKPTLFIKPAEAYLLYKQPDNTNVAVHLKLATLKWEVVEKKRKEGNAIDYKLLKCEKDYIKEKKEYGKKE